MAPSPIRDFALDEDGDIAVVNGDFAVVAGAEAVRQGIRIRVLTFLGEVWLDNSLGVDYINQILVKNPDPLVVRELVRLAILGTPDVVDVVGANLVREDGRTASIRYRVRTVYSTTPIEDTVEVSV